MMHKVFVYGSLKQGFGNHGILTGALYLATTWTQAQTFKMLSLGHFPGVQEGGSHAIEGELYEVDNHTLYQLDKLESNGSLYQRVETLLANGETAWMYILLVQPKWSRSDRGVESTDNNCQVWAP